MALNVSPTYLDFPDSESDTARHMYLGNPNSGRIIFKVKTTAPKDFCVKPNVGIIDPNDNKEVTIVCLGNKDRAASRKKVKFLLVSALVTTDEYDSDLTQLWSHVESTAKDQMHNKKVKVVYSDEPTNHDTSENHGDDTTADVSAFANANSPIKSNSSVNGHSTGLSETNGLKNRSVPSVSDDSKKEIQTKTDRKQSDKVIQPKSANVGGLPVHMVILLVLVAFLIGWKLF